MLLLRRSECLINQLKKWGKCFKVSKIVLRLVSCVRGGCKRFCTNNNETYFPFEEVSLYILLIWAMGIRNIRNYKTQPLTSINFFEHQRKPQRLIEGFWSLRKSLFALFHLFKRCVAKIWTITILFSIFLAFLPRENNKIWSEKSIWREFRAAGFFTQSILGFQEGLSLKILLMLDNRRWNEPL